MCDEEVRDQDIADGLEKQRDDGDHSREDREIQKYHQSINKF